MSDLPITHMTLYKHGVGFFQRRGLIHGREVNLSFRVDEMNDILKSLTVIVGNILWTSSESAIIAGGG